MVAAMYIVQVNNVAIVPKYKYFSFLLAMSVIYKVALGMPFLFECLSVICLFVHDQSLKQHVNAQIILCESSDPP